jgi:predicted dehydrogenase
MRIGIVGVSNHAARLRKLVSGFSDVDSVYAFHPVASRIRDLESKGLEPKVQFGSDLTSLLTVDRLIIASPPDTHKNYLELALKNRVMTLCEKPPVVSIQDLDWLMRLPEEDRGLLQFNFNHRSSAFVRSVREAQDSGRYGKLISLDFWSCHGLSFESGFAESWRAGGGHLFGKGDIVSNLAIHYLDSAMELCGKLQRLSLRPQSFGPIDGVTDTVQLRPDFESGILVNVICSYASPLRLEFKALFQDALVEFRSNNLRVFSPRRSFDASGRFCEPKEQSVRHWPTSRDYFNESLELALRDFIFGKKDGERHLAAFEASLTVTRALLESTAGLKSGIV